jgi:NAD(P)-dependent dehydrogenase (short-subunit alcohol dehydrogenase family)
VVTGGGTGIGLATAERLAAEGAHVFITGRRETELEKAVAALGDATAGPGDVSVAADVDRPYERVRERGRGLDVLFANAGVDRLARVDELTEADHDRIFERLARPDEIAAAVVLLASSQSSFVHGINLYVDGGMDQV